MLDINRSVVEWGREENVLREHVMMYWLKRVLFHLFITAVSVSVVIGCSIKLYLNAFHVKSIPTVKSLMDFMEHLSPARVKILTGECCCLILVLCSCWLPHFTLLGREVSFWVIFAILEWPEQHPVYNSIGCTNTEGNIYINFFI